MGRKLRVFQVCWLAVAGLLALVACGGSAAEADDVLAAVEFSRAASWLPLGGNLSPDPAAAVSGLALAAAPRQQPVVAFSYTDPVNQADETLVARWSGGWGALGPPLLAHGPALASDRQRHVHVCTGGGPFVQRWRGASWAALGGSIGEETGYKGARYQVDACGGLVFDSSDTPVVAWSADVGAKANAVYAARWNHLLQKWEGLGPGGVGGRATTVSLGIDGHDRLYLATYSPGGSYGGGATTRVWRWQGSSWTQLGPDMTGTDSPVVAADEDTAYLTFYDKASGALRVMQWQQGRWQELPSPGAGMLPSLAFTPSGKLVVAAADGSPSRLWVKLLQAGSWHAVGSSVSDAPDRVVGGLALRLDAHGRPCVAWHDQDSSGGRSSVLVSRYSASLP